MANLSNINNKFIVEDSGDVGIGVTTATTKLHIGGVAPGDSIIRQDSTVSGTNWEIGERAAGKWQIFEDDGDTIVATFMSTGKVGIGTTNPGSKLHVESLGAGNANGTCVYLNGDTPTNFPVMRIDNATGGNATDSHGLLINNTAPGSGLRVNNGGNTALIVKGDGKVGIGTDSPSFQLSIENHDTTTSTAAMELDGKRTNGTDGAVGELIFSNNGDTFATVAGFRDGSDNKGSLQFQTQDSSFATRMTISSEGTVGIGTTSPSVTTSLHIKNATSNSYATLRLEGSNRGGILQMYQGVNPVSSIQTDQSGNTYFSTSGVFGSTTLSAKMTILTAGNVGIGTTSPDHQLDVAKSAIIGSESVISSTTNSENMLIVKGKNNYSDGTTWYGDYGQILLDATSNMTGSAKKYLITNALDNNKFAIVRSDFNAIPTVNSTANGVNIGTADFVIDNSGKVGIGTTLPTSQLYVNNTADGDKIRWGRSDALVGSVGTYNGVPYIGYQGGAGGGIMFNGLSIEPTALGFTRSDDTNDIGSVNNRWKNIYLGGGAFLGGTGAANKLDYYEEGTWTPSISHNNGTGVIPIGVSGGAYYVKVGKLVHVFAYLVNVNPNGNAGGAGPYYAIKGLPFTAISHSVWSVAYANTTMTSYGGYASGDNLYFMKNGTNGQCSNSHVNGTFFNGWGSNVSFMFQAVYQTTN